MATQDELLLIERYGPPSSRNGEYRNSRVHYRLPDGSDGRGLIHYINHKQEYIIQADGPVSETLLVVPEADIISTARDAEYQEMADFHEDAQKEERRARRLRSRAARLLPLLYADLPATGGEIDEIERELEEYGLAYDQATRRIVAIADEDDEEE